MVKEDVIKQIEELRILTANYNKFKEYVDGFTSEPRCKKGVLEFINSLFSYKDESGNSYPAVYGKVKSELGLKLTVNKSQLNITLFKNALNQLGLESSAGQKLVDARIEIVKLVCEYVKYIQSELDKSQLTDARERQVYLRRALARLKTLFGSYPPCVISKDAWSDVRPCEWVDYLNSSMDELISKHFDNQQKDSPWVLLFDTNGLDEKHTVDSVETFLDYLDTFVKY